MERVQHTISRKREGYYTGHDKPTRSLAAKNVTAKGKQLFDAQSVEPSSPETTATASKRLARAALSDGQFRQLILQPRGILYNKTDYLVLGKPYENFQAAAPTPNLLAAYYNPIYPNVLRRSG